ncbi:TetR/AcrR family transcriptional regulator [Actinokineospora enzanensis]|uniref:TetR/AcrR family transcriptional regulator n=1 Tax=Actinokineospora enzanensis TaxID=155975 RepID=UPI000525293F|nr:TetR/AcrR family transcriptional regulator [Actinokineospora enzanensis]
MDGRRARGAETRRAILARAMDIAGVDGLEGLTVGRLAADLGSSKSGIFAQFGSKEELQLATVAFAEEVFTGNVLAPALSEPRGVPRLLGLFERWMVFSRARVCQGGCFFSAVSAEFDARDGRVRDALAERSQGYRDLLVRLATEAVEEGHLPADTDVVQLVFEIVAFGRAANHEGLLTREDAPYERAIAAVRARLGR